MPQRLTKPGPKKIAPADVSSASAKQFVAEVGALVRRGRARRGITRQKLAAESGLSVRYLAQIESGRGNPSVSVLKSIADAIDAPVGDLLPGALARSPELARIHALLDRMSADELPAIAEAIEQQVNAKPDRARRIALVGLRGAGKSTLGQLLAQALGCPFIELDRLIEQEYGASLPLLVEMAGRGRVRRHERQCLERVIAAHEQVVIATAGGIVSNLDTYGYLLRHAHTVWIKASPQEHMSRVMAQGDFRPMAQNREAMSDLVAILEARSGDYARAHATLDTAGKSVGQSLAKLQELAKGWR